MNQLNAKGDYFVLYCFSDDSALMSNTLSQFNCDLWSIIDLDGESQMRLKDAYFDKFPPSTMTMMMTISWPIQTVFQTQMVHT